MKRKLYKGFIKAVCAFCALCMLLLFSSCGNGGESSSDEAVFHTVTINANNGSEATTVSVRDGQHATQPADPVKDNYIFVRWQSANGRDWDFEVETVTSDVTINAVWMSAVEVFEIEPEDNGSGIIIKGFKKRPNLSVINVPGIINGKKVVGIADGAFSSTSTEHAKKIILPESITYVGKEAMQNSPYVEFEINGALSFVGEAAFEGCSKLSKITLGEGLEKIPFVAFSGCSSLKTMDIPSGVTVIEENAFENCTSLTSVVLPAEIKSIEDSSFFDCNNLKTVFFKGTEEDFDAIEIADGNDALTNASLCIYSEERPTEEGLFWHYGINNSPVIW